MISRTYKLPLCTSTQIELELRLEPKLESIRNRIQND